MVKAKLTPKGVDLYYHHLDKLIDQFPNSDIKRRMPLIDSEGYTKF